MTEPRPQPASPTAWEARLAHFVISLLLVLNYFLGFIFSLHKVIPVCLKKEREDRKGGKEGGIEGGRKEQNKKRTYLSERSRDM